MIDRASDPRPSRDGEEDRLAVELRYMTRHFEWNPSEEIVAAIVKWHIEASQAARADGWRPGMALCNDPLVQEVINRYYGHQIRAEMMQLMGENTDLKRKFLEVLACIRFYALGGADNGARAKALLESLLALALRKPPAEIIPMSRDGKIA